jgi:hypothetical protein
MNSVGRPRKYKDDEVPRHFNFLYKIGTRHLSGSLDHEQIYHQGEKKKDNTFIVSRPYDLYISDEKRKYLDSINIQFYSTKFTFRNPNSDKGYLVIFASPKVDLEDAIKFAKAIDIIKEKLL